MIGNFHFSRSDDTISIEAARHEQDGTVTGISLRFQFAGIPLRLADGNPAYLYVFPLPVQKNGGPDALFLGSVDRSLLVTTIFIAVFAGLATWMITRRITGPIEELQAAARDFAAVNLGRRVTTRGSDEIAELGRSFNVMAAELEKVQGLKRNWCKMSCTNCGRRSPDCVAALTPSQKVCPEIRRKKLRRQRRN